MLKRALGILGALLALALLAVLAFAWALWRTLPPANESRAVAGLERPGTIEYDSAGVPRIRAENERDLAFLQGYAHARDRRFQMELQRRAAAGRLAEVVGRAALPSDRRFRRFNFVAVADSAVARFGAERRALFESYAAGVNAWDRAHPAPPELAVLGMPREPWRARDSQLTVLVMFDDLNETGETERMIERMDAALPRELVAFLLPESTPLDVALDGAPAPAAPPLPGPGVVDVRAAARAALPARAAAGRLLARADDERVIGSNNWAIAPSRTATGGAIYAGDPHLTLRVPVIWHRQRIEGGGIAATGITLPGVPGVVMGTNGRVAWSMTNVGADAADLVRLEIADAETTAWRGPAGPERFRVRREVIRVKGAPPETLRVLDSRFGPVIGPSARGGLLALQWVALDPWMLDFDLGGIDRAESVSGMIAALRDYRGPAQNFLMADAGGHIGFAIGGQFPRRAGFDSRRPRAGADANAGWRGWMSPDSIPHVVDPPQGFLTTANQRTVGGWAMRAVTGTLFGMPYRARRIHDVLASRTDWTVDRVSALQNDVDDGFLAVTAAALDRALTREACAKDDTLARVRKILDGWTHRADTTSVAHFLLRLARPEINAAAQAPLVAACVAADSNFTYVYSLGDEVTRRLLEARPRHLLDPAYEDWDALVRAAAKRAVRAVGRSLPGVALEDAAWGRYNRARVNHPLGDAVPALDRWLDMPHAALAGGASIVRMARPREGASMRMIVDLAHPGSSRFALPGGESGHFLSKHYGDSFGAWVAGGTQPLEPGPAVSRIALSPARH
jgi:penicillin amidase